MRFGLPVLQYFCSECGLLLKQSETELKHAQLGRGIGGKEEECPKCGSLLSYTLQQRRRAAGHASLVIEKDLNEIQSLSSSFIPRFQTAYEEYNNNNRFGFDIYKIDSFLNLNTGESLCIIGEQKYTQLLLARLCVNTLMMWSKRRKRRGAENGYCTVPTIFIDAGNSLDIYQYVSFARQYGLDVKKFLQSIVVSRMFTIYQLANTIIYDLPKLIIQHLQQQQTQQQNFEPKVIVISDLLDMFVNDPYIKVEEAKNLLKEIMVSILRTRRRREILGNCLIVISLSCRHQQQESLHAYNKILLGRFDKRIEIIDGSSGCNGSLNVKTIKNKNDHRGVDRQSKLFSVTQKDLLILPWA